MVLECIRIMVGTIMSDLSANSVEIVRKNMNMLMLENFCKVLSWFRRSFESDDFDRILLSLYERVDLRTPEICLLVFPRSK